MPLNVRKYWAASFGVLLFLVSLSAVVGAQVTEPQSATAPQTPPPTSGDVMRDRISKSKAFIVVRNYNAAIYELENLRKETSDAAVQGVVNVLLMNSYLEQGDYKRAQDLLQEFYTAQKANKPNASASYQAVAGQIVKGARSRVERYRALGLSVSDRTLPLEALNDLEKMRETLEQVITQSKEIGSDRAKTSDAMAMLEEASNSRSMLARDDYDSRRWKDEVADTREKMAVSRSVVTSAVTEMPSGATVATNTSPAPGPQKPPTGEIETTILPKKIEPETNVIQTEKPAYVPSTPPATPSETPKIDTPKNDSPLNVGSLVEYATSQPKPVYPTAAKVVRATGIVKVEVTVNETGEVAQVQKTSGPSMLQAAATDAIKKWKFKPFLRDGQPVKATGFVNFNFAL